MSNILARFPSKSWIGASLTVGLLALSPSARAEIEVARGSLTLKAKAEQQYDSNIFANAAQQGDWVTVLTPSGDFKREAGTLNLRAQAGVKVQHFADNNEQDTSDPFGRLELKLPRRENKGEGYLDAGARRAEEADYFVNTRSKFDEIELRGGAAYFPSEKLGVRTDANYNDRNYTIINMSDIRTKAVGADLTLEALPKVTFFAGAGARWVTTYNVPASLPKMDSEDFKARIGAEGDLLPKVTGEFAVGWVHRRFRTVQGGDRAGLLFDGALVWHPDDETTVSMKISRDFDTTPVDQSVMQLNARLDIRRALREKIFATTGFGHLHSNFVGVGVSRRDDAYMVSETIDFVLSQRFTASVNSSYNLTNSDNAFSDYSRYIVGLSLTAIF